MQDRNLEQKHYYYGCGPQSVPVLEPKIV